MKTGLTLDDFVAETERQAKTKRDFLAPSGALSMGLIPKDQIKQSPGGFPMHFGLRVGSAGVFPVRRLMHQQLATQLKVPWQYYERMLQETDRNLLGANVDYWLQRNSEKRMVRTIDGDSRAYLSDRYRPLDNFDLLRAVRPVLEGAPGMRFESVSITEDRFYIKAFTDRIMGDVKVGEPVQAGVLIQNSEVGQGSLKVEPMILVLSCLNGAVVQASGVRKYHVGRGADALDEAAEFYSDTTRRAEDEAFWRKVIDVVKACFEQVKFDRILERYRQAAKVVIPHEVKLEDVVEVTAEKYGLNETERGMVLRKLIDGGDMTQWGLGNAITAAAQDDGLSYDRASELEQVGGEVLELEQKDWEAVTKS